MQSFDLSQDLTIPTPNFIIPENINTEEKARNNEKASVMGTQGRGRNHGKMYYKGTYKGLIKINGTIYRTAKIKTTEKGQKAKIKGHIRSDIDRSIKLINDFNERRNTDFAKITNRIWEDIAENNLLESDLSEVKVLRRWLQIYSYVEWAKSSKKRAKRYIFNDRFFGAVYGWMDKCNIVRPKDRELSSFKDYWKRITSYYAN